MRVPWALPDLTGQPTLSPSITPDEEQWWAVERKKYLRTHLLRMGLPMFAVFTVAMAISKPEKLLMIPLVAAIAFGAAWLQARTREKATRDQEVRWKRIRDSLLADSEQIGNERPPEPPQLPADSQSAGG